MLNISVSKLQQFCDPFAEDVWGVGGIHKVNVNVALIIGDLNPSRDHSGFLTTMRDHAGHIAWLVTHGWNQNPIRVHVQTQTVDGSDTRLTVKVTDGLHRLAAAIYRNDEFIPVLIQGNQVYAAVLFGGETKEESRLQSEGMFNKIPTEPVVKRGGFHC
jgi:hypothetical protein